MILYFIRVDKHGLIHHRSGGIDKLISDEIAQSLWDFAKVSGKLKREYLYVVLDDEHNFVTF